MNPAPPRRRRWTIGQKQLAGIAIFVVVVVGSIEAFQHLSTAKGSITGTFVGWTAVDSAHGYANITLTNNGDTEATANCTVEVTDDFGDTGFDYLSESVPAHQSTTGRIALTVTGNGAMNVTTGTVKDC